jgi:hypothetical protein
MKAFLLAIAAWLVMGTVAVAQTYDENRRTGSPSTPNSTQQNDSAMNRQTGGSTDPAAQVGVNSPDYRPDYRGTELEKAYRMEPKTGWQDPNITKSANGNPGGGGGGGM